MTKLTSVTLPVGLTDIQNSAFSGCTALRSITIPASVTNIGQRAFNNCSGLATVTVMRESTGTSFTGTALNRGDAILANNGVFNGTAANLVIRVPSGSANAYKADTNWSVYASKIQ